MNRLLLQRRWQLRKWATRGFMSGLPSRSSQTQARDAFQVLAAGIAAVAAGTYVTMHLTESKRKIAMDALQDSGLRIEKPAPVSSLSKAKVVDDVIDTKPEKYPNSKGDPEKNEQNHATNGVIEDSGESETEVEGRDGAFNPVTGEINWDCPCLGGMAHGSCGQEFREAFSCFVYSEEEPKGINCVEKFKNMQDCFRRHPEEYAEGMTQEFMSVSVAQTLTTEIADDGGALEDSPDTQIPASEGAIATNISSEVTTNSTRQSDMVPP